jgi:hypothetical protein
MKKNFLIQLLCCASLLSQTVFATPSTHYISLLKEMFTQVTVKKNDHAIPTYYDNDFELHSNGKTISFNEFLQMHQAIYKTPIQYSIRYDEPTLIEQGNKVAGRLFITTKKPNEPAREIEVILIAEYKNDKLYRLWELTYPDWSKMKAFQKNG